MTSRFDPVLEAFDDTPRREFLKAKEVFGIREHFFMRNEVPYLAVLVTYGLQPIPTSVAVEEKGSGRGAGWRPPVSEADLPLWNALRDWRTERAKRDGVPTYMIATNRQLAAMVERRPGSLSALAAVEGIGKAKLEKYEQELLALLARPRTESAEPRRENRPAEAKPPPDAVPDAPPPDPSAASPRPAAAHQSAAAPRNDLPGARTHLWRSRLDLHRRSRHEERNPGQWRRASPAEARSRSSRGRDRTGRGQG